MKAGEIFDYKGVRFRVENEKSEFSCEGCALVIYIKDKIGCLARSEDKIFATCKHDHVIFVKV